MMDDLLATKHQPSPLMAQENTHLSAPYSFNSDAKNADKTIEIATDILTRLFKQSKTNIAIQLWNGANILVGSEVHKRLIPAFTLVINQPKVIILLATNSKPMQLAQCYFNGDIDIEGDFFAAISLKDCHFINISWHEKLIIAYKTAILANKIRHQSHQQKLVQRHLIKNHEICHQLTSSNNFTANKELNFGDRLIAHTKTENHAAIAFHYDVSNTFYALWLDKSMVYSCAYFEHSHNSLEQAQFAKLEHICKKLMLKAGDHFLDIGCGWGALVLHAAKYYGVIAHGITLSEQQLIYARQRIAQEGLHQVVTVNCCDYRDMVGQSRFDKIASIGMFEHVGLKNLATYFSCVHALLKPGGLFLNHGITHDVEGWQKTLSTEFINRYIFPDGQLDTVSNIMCAMERSKFEIADCESLRAHYALTLRQWVARLELRHDVALETVSESTYRIWRLYMAASALEFEGGELGIYQILAAKRNLGLTVLPLTRRNLYAESINPY